MLHFFAIAGKVVILTDVVFGSIKGVCCYVVFKMIRCYSLCTGWPFE